jgi:hypothetical protein
MLLQRVRQESFVCNQVEEIVFSSTRLLTWEGPLVCDCSDVCPEESLRLNDNSQTSDIKTAVHEGLL